MNIKSQIANFITSIRIIGALALFFLKPLEMPFFIVYTFCGISDGIDGFVARKLKIVSKFGSKLDSAADLCFYTAMMIKIIGYLSHNLYIWNWVYLFVVLALRLFCYSFSAVKFKCFASVHSILNKATGLFVFLVPYITLTNIFIFNIYAAFVCTIALAAVFFELKLYFTRTKEQMEKKTS